MNEPVFIRERKEIAKAMNFGKYPVLSMEIGITPPGWDPFTVYNGCKVKIFSTRHDDLYHVCTLSMYGDEQPEEIRQMPWKWDKLHLSSPCTCLDASFGFHDVQEMIVNANAPVVKPRQEVIVVFNDTPKKVCYVRKMVVGDRVTDFYQTVATISNPKRA